jgi:hypothetical protein
MLADLGLDQDDGPRFAPGTELVPLRRAPDLYKALKNEKDQDYVRIMDLISAAEKERAEAWKTAIIPMQTRRPSRTSSRINFSLDFAYLLRLGCWCDPRAPSH